MVNKGKFRYRFYQGTKFMLAMVAAAVSNLAFDFKYPVCWLFTILDKLTINRGQADVKTEVLLHKKVDGQTGDSFSHKNKYAKPQHTGSFEKIFEKNEHKKEFIHRDLIITLSSSL